MTQIEIFDMIVKKACDPRPMFIAWVHIRVGEVPSNVAVIINPVRSIGGVI
jgi:hypothetical protein